MLAIDPEWYSVYLEFFRRVRTDEDFRRRVEAITQDAVAANRARGEQLQRDGVLRDDLETKEIALFLNVVLNGLVLLRAGGDEVPPRDLVLRLLEDAIGPRAPSRTRPRRSAGAADVVDVGPGLGKDDPRARAPPLVDVALARVVRRQRRGLVVVAVEQVP